MKIQCLTSLSSLALVALLNTSVHGSPIQYTAFVAGAPQIWSQTQLPVDLAKGGSYELGSPPLAPTSFDSVAWSTRSISLDGNATVSFGAWDPADPTKYLGGVSVAVPFRGSIFGDGTTSDLQGGYSGTGVSAQASSFPGVSLPGPLLDLVSHPDRVHLSAYTTGGHMSYLLTTLSIDSPVQLAPVPEPSVLATLLLGLGGLAWRRRRRPR
jgi:hypothetical protein